MPADILQRILATKRDEVAALRARITMPDLMARAADQSSTRGFARALTAASAPVALIAEVKKASPSKGVIRADFDPVALAQAYHAGGAACLSVLTDATYFQGSLDYLTAIRAAVPLPLLRKDFVIDVAQIYEARGAGADAVLVIVAAVPSPARIAEFVHVAGALGMDALVEVHDARELALAAEAGARLIGVNNRDLASFEVRLETSEELLPLLPPGALGVAESGVFTRADVSRMGAAGARAVLVGESLMRQPDVEAATRRLLTGDEAAP